MVGGRGVLIDSFVGSKFPDRSYWQYNVQEFDLWIFHLDGGHRIRDRK
jgi:hypothetical protein